jgi:hemoglobin/transferrin/lactoferrin receptor protein
MKSSFTFLLLISSFLAFGQTILDADSKKPVVNAEVSVKNKSAITDQNGHFTLEIHSNEIITVEADNYPTVEISLQDFQEGIYYLSSHLVQLTDAVISPYKWSNPKTQTGHKVVTFQPQQWEFQNPQTTADLLGMTPNVFIQKSQLGGGSPMIRGFSTNRVLITVDGVRMNTAIFRSGNLQNVISIDANALEGAEVLMGPGSLMYGSDAIGGVMNFKTLTPQFSTSDKLLFDGSFLGRYSSADNELTSHLDFNLAGKKFSSMTSLTFSRFSDLKMGKHGPDEYLKNHLLIRENGEDVQVDNPDPRKQVSTGYEQYNLMQKFRYAPNENWDLNYGFHYSNSSDVPRYDRFLVYRNGNLRFAEWYYGPQLWIMNTLSVESKSQTALYDQAKLTLAHQYFEESRHSRNAGNAKRTDQYEKVNVISANLDLFKKWNEKNTLYYGVEALFNKVGSRAEVVNITDGSVAPDATRYPDGSTWDSYGIYVSNEYNVTDKLTLQGGLRYNYVNSKSTFDNTFYEFPFDEANFGTGKLTGNLGLNFHPTTSTDVRAMFSTGFRAPNIDDIGKIFESTPGSVVVPNPDLKDEYAYSGELGITQKLGKFAKLDVAVYYVHLQDALVRRDYTLNGQDSIMYQGEMSQVQTIMNAAKAFSYGLEARLDVYLNRQFYFFGSVNYQKGEEELDNGDKAPMRHSAPLMFRTGLDFHTSKFKAELYAVYNGEVSNEDLAPSEQEKDYMYAIDENGKPYSPSWYTLNLKTRYNLNKNLTFTAGWENITNQRYRPYSSGIVAAGSNLILSVRYNF